MKCPYCNGEGDKVIDSRPADGNTSIRRRRQCEHCGKRYTTYEKIDIIPIMVKKKNGDLERYDRSKIATGIIHSCHKRSKSMKEIDELVDSIETQIFNSDKKEIDCQEIGEIVMNRLKDFDSVAYVRFASIYRNFKDVNTFMDEIKDLLGNEDNKTE